MRLVVPLLACVVACSYDWAVDPKPVPCRADGECGANAFCAFPDGRCGEGLSGTCQRVPPVTACGEAASDPVCTCKGAVRKHPCQATAFGEDPALAMRCYPFDYASDRPCGVRVCPGGQRCDPASDGGVDARCVPK